MSSLTLLPLMPGELDAGVNAALSLLAEMGLGNEESLLKLEADFNGWLDAPDAVKFPPASVETVMLEAGWYQKLAQPKERTAGRLYGLIIAELSRRDGVSRRAAAVTLSYLPLMVSLAIDFRLSAAGIAEVINESDDRVLLHWKGIRKIMNHLQLSTTLDASGVEMMLAHDKTTARDTFKDADTPTIIELLAQEAAKFDLGRDFASAVENTFAPVGTSAFVPYLQTLFYVCAVTEFYDHPSEYLYTFQPRGALANQLFGVFPPEMAAAGNPVLNNFKAVDRLSTDWAAARDDNPEQAFALVGLILGLSSLSYGARRYMARQMRGALLRYIEATCPEPLALPALEAGSEVFAFLDRVSAAETNTTGIIEQRVADFLASVFFAGASWRARGLRDPVNATNTSSKKLGDADFQNVGECSCVAVEAHAGRLTPVYVDEHLRTLRRNLPARLEEWESIEDLAKWKLKLVFLVHENACDESQPQLPSPISSQLEIVTYAEWTAKLRELTELDETKLVAAFNQYVVDVLSSDSTPYSTKENAMKLLHASRCSGRG